LKKNSIVIVNIIGGLGNQMFQYAFGYALAKRLGVKLVLDVSDFSGYSLHNGFELRSVFGVGCERASNKILTGVFGIGGAYKKKIILSDRFKLHKFYSSIYKENNHGYNSRIYESKLGRYYHGYWQTEKYFYDYADDIRRQFMFKDKMDVPNQVIADEIENSNSVSLHIRRGDYLSDTKSHSVHGLCDLEYYQRAIRYVASHVHNPVFYVFSDDISWVKENLKIPFETTYVGINRGKQSYNDMRLMSICKHNIIANSSFSWWGGWLGDYDDKIVVAPSKWFADNSIISSDIIPDRWVKI